MSSSFGTTPTDVLLQRQRNYHAAQWIMAQKKEKKEVASDPSSSMNAQKAPKKMPIDLLSVKTEVFEKLNQFNVQFHEFEDDLNTAVARLECINILEKRFDEFEQHMNKQMRKTWDSTLKAESDHVAKHKKFRADVAKEFNEFEEKIQLLDENMDAPKDAVQAAFDEVSDGKVAIVTNEGNDSDATQDEATRDNVSDVVFLDDLNFADLCSGLRSLSWKRYTFTGKEYKRKRKR